MQLYVSRIAWKIIDYGSWKKDLELIAIHDVGHTVP